MGYVDFMKRSKWRAWCCVAAILVVTTIALRSFTRESHETVLRQSDEFIFYSLSGKFPSDSPNSFHRFKILGQLTIKNSRQKSALINALYKAMADGSPLGAAGCHSARHGFRGIKGGRIVDVTICFECYNVYFYDRGERKVGGKDISRSPEKLFNQVLRSAGVSLDKEYNSEQSNKEWPENVRHPKASPFHTPQPAG